MKGRARIRKTFLTEGTLITGEGARPPGEVGSWKLEAGRGGQVGGSLALSSLSVQSLWVVARVEKRARF